MRVFSSVFYQYSKGEGCYFFIDFEFFYARAHTYMRNMILSLLVILSVLSRYYLLQLILLLSMILSLLMFSLYKYIERK